ncbi:Transcription-repair-coupling factor [Paenibacillus auburnensis]|uniref:Transcription-repair-coupling factor n=1 Tax=Paenibacillus auburnensis TaxID=2905649 RepID=A0ABN8GK13_9BACL|nr:helicase-related protein [Paenibacillus auburnensis]CAH1209606.1 Transcription-repair-coupling factor [Paenibacillus auburnensis]
MRVSVYAVEIDGRFKIWISLNLAIDLLWWSAAGERGWRGRAAEKLVLLSSSLPLGWAVKLRECFRFHKMMCRWSSEEWAAYLRDSLQEEMRREEESGGKQQGTWMNSVEVITEPLRNQEQQNCWARIDSGCDKGESESYFSSGSGDGLLDRSESLGIAADRLVEMLSGRSLLQPEVEGLLTEQLAGMERDWRSAAQLAHLQGRLKLQAAVSAGIGGKGEGRSNNNSEKAEGKKGDHSNSSSRRGEGDREYPSNSRSKWAEGDREYPCNSSSRRGEGDREYHSNSSSRRDEGGRVCLSRAGLAAALRLPLLLWRRGAARRRAVERCLRCGSVATGRTPCAACGLAGCAYCEACLALGRSRACALLLRSAASPAVRGTAGISPTVAARRWGLSAAQAGAAGAALQFLTARRQHAAGTGPERFLLWAVTGAGKTEITFPLLETVLAAGGRALVATPRRDVVLELAPRLARAFPAETLAVLYGGSQDRWVAGQLTIATTHQLLRFHHGFDLVIIDELDAFPYHNNPMLAFAAEQACKPDGVFIFLSATPPQKLQRQAHFGKLPHARVPVRYHGHPLPVPRLLTMNPVQLCMKRGALPAVFLKALHRSLAREAQIFIFVARIAHIEGLLTLLRRKIPGVCIEGTSSKDPDRTDKVTAFRNRAITILVTTTILERGVTVPRSDVFILDADSKLFDEASLVQMAGRAGRSKDDPAGRVYFLSPEWTQSQRKAIGQVRTMNSIARKQGYLNRREPSWTL